MSTTNELAADTVVGVLGGTGPQGRGLASRLAHAGDHWVSGCRPCGRCCCGSAGWGPWDEQR
jgi:hypothetical protein